MGNKLRYFCTAERCIWRVQTSEKTAYCAKIKCPYGCLRAMVRSVHKSDPNTYHADSKSKEKGG